MTRNLSDNGRIYLLLLIFSLCLMLVAGSDGWLRSPGLRADTAMFFMGGKSWMEGLIPYRDFADSKGPLLWLIYGIGYLISPHNYYGVFIFDTLFYWLNFCILFKTALLLIHNSSRALLATMGITFFYFYPALHFEVKIEDFCHLFNSIALYVIIQSFCNERYRLRYALCLGLCCGCTLMIKYSYFLTLLVPSFMLFLYLLAQRKAPWKSLGLFLAGILTVSLPFMIYLGAVGAFGNFMQEYFLNTVSTIFTMREAEDAASIGNTARFPYNMWYLFFTLDYLAAFMWAVLIAFVVGLMTLKRSRWTLYTLILWYACSVILFSVVGSDHPHYYSNLCVFSFPGIVWFANLFRRLDMPATIMGGACILLLLAVITTHYVYSEFHFAGRDALSYAEAGKAAALINEKEKELGRKPTISYYGEFEKGEHIQSNAIAGTKYWSPQAGMSEEMTTRHREEIFEKLPDFVVINSKETAYRHRLEEAGYSMILEYYPRPAVGDQVQESALLFSH